MAQRVSVIGLGDMGSGIAKNLIRAGFDTAGFDLSPARMRAFTDMGGVAAASAREAGHGSQAVFVMVMDGSQARSVIFDGDGLLASMSPGSTILMTATISASDIRGIGRDMDGSGVGLIDTPVSGGFPGAQSGALTMMAAAADTVLDKNLPFMEAVSASIHRVGTEPGMGQTVKACLQSLIGSIFTATCEATALAAVAGVDADVLRRVFATSSAGSQASGAAMDNIVAGRFEKSGSHIRTMYKDMTLVMDLARELGVPLLTAATAMQLFQAGITRYPDGDNWAVAKVTEGIVGRGLRLNGPEQ